MLEPVARSRLFVSRPQLYSSTVCPGDSRADQTVLVGVQVFTGGVPEMRGFCGQGAVTIDRTRSGDDSAADTRIGPPSKLAPRS
jgi:hypothetical protein